MSIRALKQADSGGALVELALVLPVIVLVFVGTIDFGRVFNTAQALTDSARAGAQWGSSTPARSGQITEIETIAEAASGIAGVDAVAVRNCQCASDAGAFTPTAPSANNCTSPVTTSCPGGGHLMVTVTVTASKTFTTIMAGGLPGFMQSMPLSRTATMRAQ